MTGAAPRVRLDSPIHRVYGVPMTTFKCYGCGSPLPLPDDDDLAAAWRDGTTETPGLCEPCAD